MNVADDQVVWVIVQWNDHGSIILLGAFTDKDHAESVRRSCGGMCRLVPTKLKMPIYNPA